MSVDSTIREFQQFLNHNWERVSDWLIDPNDQGDWLQANWEILVESRLCKPGEEYLLHYGEGADCNGTSSRVWMPECLPNRRIVAETKDNTLNILSGEIIDSGTILNFEMFVASVDGNYWHGPPFDHVYLESCFETKDTDYIIQSDKVAFTMQEYLE